ncbi:uncharacterized protein BKA78DRAFT_310477 [Phyllosticta capitalensis]|uniref:uncharacterized protein n=1 Tax=Phyllosticta capitalensis TaxID=121624 RepID=UPI0031300287
MGKRLLLCLVALSGSAYSVAVPPVFDPVPAVSSAATPAVSGAKSAIPSATSHASIPLAPTSPAAIDNSTTKAIFVAGIPTSSLMPLAQLLSTIVNTLIGLITKNYADVVAVTNATTPMATAAPAIAPRDPQVNLGPLLGGVSSVVAITQTNALGQVVGTALAALPPTVSSVGNLVPVTVSSTKSNLNSLLSNPIAAIQVAISSLIASLFGGADQSALLGSLQSTLNNLLTKRNSARDFKRLEKRQEYAPPPETRGPYSPPPEEEASPASSSPASFSPVSTGSGSAEAVTPGVIPQPESLTPLQDVPTSLAALDYAGSLAVASVPPSVLSYASTADPIAELLASTTLGALSTPFLERRQASATDKAPIASALDNQLLVASILSNPNLNPLANPLINPVANPIFNPAANQAINPLADPSVANSIAASVASGFVDTAQTIAGDAASAATSIAASVDPSLISTPEADFPIPTVVSLLPSSVPPVSFTPTTEYYLPTTPITNYLSSINPTIASEMSVIAPTLSQGVVLDKRQLAALSSFASHVQDTLPSSIKLAPSALASVALDKVTNPMELLAKMIAAQASPVLNVLASQVQAVPTAGAALVAAQLSVIQPLLSAIPSAVSSDLAQATSVAGPALGQISGALEALKSIDIPSAIGEVASAASAVAADATQVAAKDVPAVVSGAVSNISRILPTATAVVSVGNPSNPVAATVSAAIPGVATVVAGAGISAPPGSSLNLRLLPTTHVSVEPSEGVETSADDEAGLKEVAESSSGGPLSGLTGLFSSLIPSGAASSSPLAQLLLQLQIAPIMFFLPLLLSNPLAVGGSSLNPLLSSLSSSSSSSSSLSDSSSVSSNPLASLFSANPLSSVLESSDLLLSLLADSSSSVLGDLAASLSSKAGDLFKLTMEAQLEAAKLGAEVAKVLMDPVADSA